MDWVEMKDSISNAFNKYTTSWCSIDKEMERKKLCSEALTGIDKIYQNVSLLYISARSINFDSKVMRLYLPFPMVGRLRFQLIQ